LVGGLVLGAGPASGASNPPLVVTGGATPVSTTSETVTGTVNPEGSFTTYTYDYGLTASFGLSDPDPAATVGSGSTTTTLPVTLTGLTPGKTYYYVLIADGFSRVQGATESFVTGGTAPSGAPTVTTGSASAITTSTATLNGSVNPNSLSTTYYFEWGLSPSLANVTATESAGAGAASVAVSANIGSLTDGDTYDFELVASNSAATDVLGGVQSFVAGEVGAPLVVTEPATSTTGTTATLNGTVNPEDSSTTYHFEWGLTTSPFANVTPTESAGAGTATEAVSASIGGLTPGDTYYFELVASNTAATDVVGGVESFVAGTSGVATTDPATSITSVSATLNGTVDPEGLATNYYFEYGTNTAYDPVTPTESAGAGTAPVPVSATVSGLTPGTTYDFQLVATNSNGTVYGGNESFVAGQTSVPNQISGVDAIGTSIAISEAEFPNALSAGGVVLARDDFFSDALTGGPLAAAVHGPLLLTEGADEATTIDQRTLAEIQRILPAGGTVYILGGDLAISPNVDNQLGFLGYNVHRVAGDDEFGTAVDVAELLGNPGVVFETTGLFFADAASAVPAAIEDGGAILLTAGNVQNSETAAYLAANPGDVRYTIGGVLAAGGADPGATNISGADEFGTSAAVASHFFPSPNMYGVATGLNYPDALGGGVYMATGGRLGPVLLVNTNAPLPPSIAIYLAGIPADTPGTVFGGPLAVASSVIVALETAVG
jgi:hypothetical protein